MGAIDLHGLLAEDRWLRGLLRGLLDEHDAADVAQDTWVLALEHGPDRSDGAPRQGWLAVVARRLALRVLRSTGRRTLREAVAARPEALPSTAAVVERLELQQRVARLVLELDEPFRTAVLLRYHEGLTPAAIAERLAVPAATVRTRLARGIERVRAQLDGAGRRAGPTGRDWRALGLVLLAPRHAAAVPGLVLLSGKLVLGGAAAAAMVLIALWLMVAHEPLRTPETGIVPPAAQAEPSRERDALEPAATRVVRKESAPAEPQPPLPAGTSVPALLRISGRVADTAGRGLAGVLLGIHVTDGPFPGGGENADPQPGGEPRFVELPGEGRVDLLGRSGGGGAFAFTLARAQGRLVALGAHATVRGSTVPAAGAAVDGLLIVAAPAVDLAGQVVDDGGEPLPGVAVSVEEGQLARFPEPLGQTFAPSFARLTTDARGAFACAGLPGVEDLALVLTRAGFAEGRVPLPPASDRGLRVVLRSLAAQQLTLRGDVRDPDGAAVPEASVSFGPYRASSDAAGRFELIAAQVRPEMVLCAVKVGRQPALLQRYGESLGPWQGKTHAVTLVLGGPALEIQGHVVGADDKPVAGLRVLLVDPTWFESGLGSVEEIASGAAPARVGATDVVTDGEGSFTVTGLAARDYRVRAFDVKTLLALVSDPIRAGTRGVVLRFPADAIRKRLAGVVLRRGGVPAAGVSVGPCLTVLEGPGGAGMNIGGSAGQWAKTDAQGRFELHDVPRYHVTLNVSGEDVIRSAPLLQTRVPPSHPGDGIVLQIASRCHFRIEPPARGVVPDAAELRDVAGGLVAVLSDQEGMSIAMQWVLLEAGQGPVLAASDETETVVFLRGGKEIGRQGVRLRPGIVTVIRP